MQFDGFFSILDWVVLAFGAYALYAAWVLKREGRIIETFLVFKDTDVKKCKDIQGYARYMSPKLWTVGLVMIAYAGISLINTYVITVSSLFWVMMAVFLVSLVWYGMEAKKAMKMYF